MTREGSVDGPSVEAPGSSVQHRSARAGACRRPRLRRMWRLAAGLALVACATTSCALNRPEVKSLRDADADQIVFADPIPTTVSALNAVPSHCGAAGNRRVRPEERRVYRVVGRITRVKREGDHDVHIALADLQNPRERLIVEFKDPDFRGTARSPHRARLVEARRSLDALVATTGVTRLVDLKGATVRVTGVGFFDMGHFQIGRSRSCMELHPVLAIELVARD